jgi:hypothetical protein
MITIGDNTDSGLGAITTPDSVQIRTGTYVNNQGRAIIIH